MTPWHCHLATKRRHSDGICKTAPAWTRLRHGNHAYFQFEGKISKILGILATMNFKK